MNILYPRICVDSIQKSLCVFVEDSNNPCGLDEPRLKDQSELDAVDSVNGAENHGSRSQHDNSEIMTHCIVIQCKNNLGNLAELRCYNSRSPKWSYYDHILQDDGSLNFKRNDTEHNSRQDNKTSRNMVIQTTCRGVNSAACILFFARGRPWTCGL